jgi:hypothetical protein
MSIHEAVVMRAVGGFPISVATSLALEAACGVHPEIASPPIPPIQEYDEIWINLRTLFRNFMGALDKVTAAKINAVDAEYYLGEEMDRIESILASHSGFALKVVFYASSYKNLEQRFKHASVRMDNTPKQKEFTAIQNKTLQGLLNSRPKGSIELFDFELKSPRHNRVLMLTNYPVDLTSFRKFGQLALLESHTGAIKPRAQWYTKFYNGKELSNVPFTLGMLQVFGDSIMFSPMDRRLREDLLAIAERLHWTAVTTQDMINYGITQLKNPYFQTVLREIVRA